MDKKKINIDKRIIYYVVCVIVFTLITLWIVMFNNGKSMTTTCIVRYGCGLVGVLLFHYFFVIKQIKINWVLIKKNIFFGAIDAIFSYICVKLCMYFNLIRGFSKRYFLMFFIIGLILYVIYLFFYEKKISDNKILALIIFFTGTLFAYSFPVTTGISWDDQIHFARVLQISQLGNTEYSKADIAIIGKTYEGAAKNLLEGQGYSIFLDDVTALYESGEKESIPYEEVSLACDEISLGSIVSYLPSVIMIILGRGFSLSYEFLIIFGRWGNVILYSTVIYFALKRLQSGKMIVFSISMFPTTLLLMSNYSYDTWGLAFSMLAYAYIIGALQDKSKKLDYKDILIVCVLFILAFLAKPIYFCMALLPLLIPKEKYSENCNVKICRIIIIVNALFILCSFILPFLISGAGGNDMRGGTDVNSIEQIKFILTNPIEYTQILLRFLWSYWSVSSSFLYVNSFAYLDGFQNGYPIFLLNILVILIDKKNIDITITNWLNRFWALVLAFIGSVFVATSLYVAFTPVGYGTINGCQPRYLLPLLFCVAYFIGDYRIISKIDKFINRRLLLVIISITYTTYSMIGLYQFCINLY